MKIKRWHTAVIFLCLLSGIFSESESFQKQPDGVLFELKKQKPTDPQWLKVQVHQEYFSRDRFPG